jgi:putative toxin-antitoxin system antitoxin component (TIGR02293 family)
VLPKKLDEEVARLHLEKIGVKLTTLSKKQATIWRAGGRSVQAGSLPLLTFQALLRLESQSGIGIALLSSLIGIPERTLARRKTAGRLTPEESERLFRISSIVERAVELFEGNMDAAVNWLLTPRKALDHQQPLHYCRTELGAREVESLIGRLEHGVFS